MERKKVPNIVGVYLDEAKEILEKASIEIEKEKKQEREKVIGYWKYNMQWNSDSRQCTKH